MSEHTKGPWLCQPTVTEAPDYGVPIIGDNLGGLVAAALPWSTEIDSGDFSRVEANARLIAASPHMFDVLEASAADPTDMTNWSDEQIRGWAYATARNARSAIAKTRGQQ